MIHVEIVTFDRFRAFESRFKNTNISKYITCMCVMLNGNTIIYSKHQIKIKHVYMENVRMSKIFATMFRLEWGIIRTCVIMEWP